MSLHRGATVLFRQKKEQREWLSSILDLSSCNLCHPVYCQRHKSLRALWFHLRWRKNTELFFPSAQLRRCDRWWSLWSVRAGASCLLPDASRSVMYVHLMAWTRTHTHTPVFTFSSQRGAKVPFPCVFRLCFELGEVILSPHGEIFSWSCKSSEDKSSYFVHSGDTCSIQFYCPLWQLLKHFMPHSGLCSLPTSCLWWRLFLPLPLYQIVFCPRFQRWIIKWFYCEICTGCRTEYFQIPPCMWFF